MDRRPVLAEGRKSYWPPVTLWLNNLSSRSQGPSASAYVTYIRSEDALRAIQCVNNVVVDGRTLKVRFNML